MALASGWYVDQLDSDYEIYWDGATWTNARRPVSSAAPTATDDPAVPTDGGNAELHPDSVAPSDSSRAGRDAPAVAGSLYPPQPPSRRRRSWGLPLGAALAGVVIGMIIGGLAVGAITAINENNARAAAAERAVAEKAALDNVFPDAVDDCNADPTYAVVSDGGRTLTIDNEGDEDYLGGLSAPEMWCIIESLKAPRSVISHMEQTTSVDGRQTESWDSIEASWSFHPDRGMDAVFEIAD